MAQIAKSSKVSSSNPGLHNYMQLASIGYGNTPMEDHMGVDLHPIFKKNQKVDPILNLLAHQAHPTDDSPSSLDITKHIGDLANTGAKLAQQSGRKLDDDHVLVLDPNGNPQVVESD